MSKPDHYVGIDKDIKGGLTPIGRIIRDAWIFGLLPESETCEGWNLSRITVIHAQVNAEWDKYGCMVSQLPPDLREKHQRIYSEAITNAKAQGWEGEDETKDDK